GEARPAPELQREVQPAHRQGDRADQREDAGDPVPRPLAANEVDRNLAPVQPSGDAAACHQSSLEVEEMPLFRPEVRCVRTVRLVEDRHRALAPSRSGSSPDHLCPLEKNLVPASKVTMGLVNRNTTTTSMSGVRPSV